MRIEELSVGDWVKFESDPYVVDKIGLGEYTEIVSLTTAKEKLVMLSDIDPIPITPEILDRNGLWVVEEDTNFTEYELFGSENFSIFHTKGTLRYRLETPQASVVCWFVHQLQHALRLAEVEKEIVL